MSILDWTVQEHTIGPGSALVIHNGGNTLEILEATGTVEVRVEGGDFSELPAGLVIYNRDRRFRFCEVKNGSDANPVTFKIYIGTGDLRDNRFTASGTLNVQGTSGDSFSDIVAALASAEGDIETLRAERSAADWLDMTGFAHVFTQATVDIVTALDNVNGIEILHGQVAAGGGSSQSELQIDGTTFLISRLNNSQTISRLFIPAGKRLHHLSAGSTYCTCIFRVL